MDFTAKAMEALNAIQRDDVVNFEQIQGLIDAAQVYAGLAQAEQLKRIADSLSATVSEQKLNIATLLYMTDGDMQDQTEQTKRLADMMEGYLATYCDSAVFGNKE